jgi:hypothetical protein
MSLDPPLPARNGTRLAEASFSQCCEAFRSLSRCLAFNPTISLRQTDGIVTIRILAASRLAPLKSDMIRLMH